MRWLGCCVMMCALAFAGCGASVGYAEVTSTPYDVYGYPYGYYDGRVVYLVGDRWMYQDGPTWFYYRTPPPGLVHGPIYPPTYYSAPHYGGYGGYGHSVAPPPYSGGHRARPYIQQAPPAPPAMRAPPARQVAPPARR